MNHKTNKTQTQYYHTEILFFPETKYYTAQIICQACSREAVKPAITGDPRLLLAKRNCVYVGWGQTMLGENNSHILTFVVVVIGIEFLAILAPPPGGQMPVYWQELVHNPNFQRQDFS